VLDASERLTTSLNSDRHVHDESSIWPIAFTKCARAHRPHHGEFGTALSTIVDGISTATSRFTTP